MNNFIQSQVQQAPMLQQQQQEDPLYGFLKMLTPFANIFGGPLAGAGANLGLDLMWGKTPQPQSLLQLLQFNPYGGAVSQAGRVISDTPGLMPPGGGYFA